MTDPTPPATPTREDIRRQVEVCRETERRADQLFRAWGDLIARQRTA